MCFTSTDQLVSLANPFMELPIDRDLARLYFLDVSAIAL
jgi:hypothetical protein